MIKIFQQCGKLRVMNPIRSCLFCIFLLGGRERKALNCLKCNQNSNFNNSSSQQIEQRRTEGH